jgi:hypothetical protein
LGGTREFLYDFILLRNRHLPLRDPTLIVMKQGLANNRLLFHFAASGAGRRSAAKLLTKDETRRIAASLNKNGASRA